jgi:hypothetical protein
MSEDPSPVKYTSLAEVLLPQFIELADYYTSEDATGADLCQMGEDIQGLTVMAMGWDDWPPDIKAFVDNLLTLVLNTALVSLHQGEAILSSQHLRGEVRRQMQSFTPTHP